MIELNKDTIRALNFSTVVTEAQLHEAMRLAADLFAHVPEINPDTCRCIAHMIALNSSTLAASRRCRSTSIWVVALIWD